MKNFITACAVLLLLTTFSLQTVMEIKNASKRHRFSDIVYKAAQKARLDGCFTEENIENIKDQLVAIDGVDERDIEIVVTKDKKYRSSEYNKDNVINYKITVKNMGKIIAAPSFFGIKKTENEFSVTKEGFVFSEAIEKF